MKAHAALLFAFLALIPASLPACGGGSRTASWPEPTADAQSDGAALPAEAGAAADVIEPTIVALASKVAPDMQREGAFVRQAIAPGQHTRVDLTLKGDECYAIIAAGQPGTMGDLDVAMLYKDPASGQLSPITQDQQNDTTAVLGTAPAPICPPKASDVVLDLSAKQGGGQVGIALYSKPNPQVRGPGPAAAGDAAEELLAKQASALAKGMDPEGPPMKQTLKEGETLPFTVTLAAGRCYTVVAVSPKGGVTDLDMRLLMPPFFTLEVERDRRADNTAVIGSPSPQCPITIFPIPYRVDVTAKKGSGPVAVRLFSKAR